MAAAAAEPSASSHSDSPPPPSLRRRRRTRRLVFDRRYGWIFDEWVDPTEEALSGGRGMFVPCPCPPTAPAAGVSGHRFCVVSMAQSFVSAVASSVNFAASSVNSALKRSESFSLPTYMVSLPLHRKNKAWFRELEHSGVVADLKLKPCRTHCTLDYC
ncbi:hypothetical protein ACP4OV_007017 [Aristida adscensionis]